MLLLALVMNVGHAQESPESEQPLAIPVGGELPAPSPASKEAAPPGPPGGGGPMGPDKLRALRTYRDQRLALRSEVEVHGGGAIAYSTGWGGPGWGWGTTTVVPNPVVTSRTWGIYQGPAALSAPHFLELAGDLERRDRLLGEIHHARSKRNAWYAVAGVGAAGLLTGMVGMQAADNREQFENANLIGLGGAALTVTGLLGASFPSAKARRLERYPSASMGPAEAQRLIDAHNEHLAQDLGLQPREVWQIEGHDELGR